MKFKYLVLTFMTILGFNSTTLAASTDPINHLVQFAKQFQLYSENGYRLEVSETQGDKLETMTLRSPSGETLMSGVPFAIRGNESSRVFTHLFHLKQGNLELNLLLATYNVMDPNPEVIDPIEKFYDTYEVIRGEFWVFDQSKNGELILSSNLSKKQINVVNSAIRPRSTPLPCKFYLQ